MTNQNFGLLFCYYLLHVFELQGNGSYTLVETHGAESVTARPTAVKPPKSPYMPFALLFAAISKKVSSDKMECLNTHYQMFRVFL